VLISFWQSCLPPLGKYFCGENTLTEEVTDCHSLNLKSVWENLNFYTLSHPKHPNGAMLMKERKIFLCWHLIVASSY